MRCRSATRELGVELEEYLPPESSAIVTVVDDEYLDRVDHALSKSAKKISKAIDSDDYDKLTKELSKAGYRIEDAIASQRTRTPPNAPTALIRLGQVSHAMPHRDDQRRSAHHGQSHLAAEPIVAT